MTTMNAVVAALLVGVVAAAFWLGWRFGVRLRSGAKLAEAGPTGAPVALDAVPGFLPNAAAPAPVAPRSVGRYRLERELGHGSMGTVHLARAADAGAPPVAIKTMALAREFDGPELLEARARFFREAEVAALLTHADIVRILEVGEDRGVAFIAMQYLPGEDLSRHTLASELLPVPVVLRTLARVAAALAYAHEHGVVHRDMKPANVMLDRSTGSVKVTDFGIAHVADACRTRTGLVLGTPSFMSPEQLTGRRLDGRSDLYSVGVMLYQLLTGELPHGSDSMAELMRAIVNDPAPDVRLRRPKLPEALANVVALALEKRPEVRYADGRQLADDLLAVAALIDPTGRG